MGIGYTDTIISSQIDGPTLTAAAAATCLPAASRKTLPPNYFDFIGKVMRIKASGRLSTVSTTPGTLRFDIRLGGTVIFDTVAIALVVTNGYTNVGWMLDLLLTLRAIGATANFFGQGTLTAPNILGSANVAMPIGGVTGMLPWNSAPAVGGNFDSTIAQQLDMFFTQTVATGSLTVHQFLAKSEN